MAMRAAHPQRLVSFLSYPLRNMCSTEDARLRRCLAAMIALRWQACARLAPSTRIGWGSRRAGADVGEPRLGKDIGNLTSILARLMAHARH